MSDNIAELEALRHVDLIKKLRLAIADLVRASNRVPTLDNGFEQLATRPVFANFIQAQRCRLVLLLRKLLAANGLRSIRVNEESLEDMTSLISANDQLVERIARSMDEFQASLNVDEEMEMEQHQAGDEQQLQDQFDLAERLTERRDQIEQQALAANNDDMEEHESIISVDSEEFPSVEHYYQACKLFTLIGRAAAQQLRQWWHTTRSPLRAKGKAREILNNARVFGDRIEPWKKEVGPFVLLRAIRNKFKQSNWLRQKLLATGEAILCQTYDEDNFYAVDQNEQQLREWAGQNPGKVLKFPLYLTKENINDLPTIGKGQNVLGVICMQIRKELADEEKHQQQMPPAQVDQPGTSQMMGFGTHQPMGTGTGRLA